MRAVLLLAICAAVSACATTGDTLRSGEVEALRASVSLGDPIAARRLAGLIAQGRLPGATIAEAIASSSTSTFSSSSMGSTTPHRKLYTIFLMQHSYHSSA